MTSVNSSDQSSDNYHSGVGQVFLSHNFKLWVVGFIFFLTFFHLFTLIAFPQSKIISDELILSIVLGLVAYLWTQELRDRHHIEGINEELLVAQKKLQNAEIDTIASLIKMVEAKDPYEHGHSSRVSRFAVAIAEGLHLSFDEKETIRRSGLLHDLGKLAIPDTILQKPDKLTDEEWDVIKKHPQNTVDILEPLRFLHLEKKIILHHHERFEGTGYPQGLQGGNIPLESRIIAVADTFDAINSTRSYRPARKPEEALAAIEAVVGSQLDPYVVQVFKKIYKESHLSANSPMNF